MPSSTNRQILGEETIKAGKKAKGKGIFNAYAKRVKDANNSLKPSKKMC